VPHGSPADAAGPPADTHRIRLSKERRRLAHAVLYSSPVTSDAVTDRVPGPHGVPSFVDKSTPGSREHHGSVASQPSAVPTWHTAVAPSPSRTCRRVMNAFFCASSRDPLPQRSLRTDSGRAARRSCQQTEMSPGPAFNPANLRVSCVLTMSRAIVGGDSFRSHRKRVGQWPGMTIKQQPCRGRSTSLSKDEHMGARWAPGVPAVTVRSLLNPLTDAMEPHHDRSRIGRHRGTELVHPYRASAVDHLGR